MGGTQAAPRPRCLSVEPSTRVLPPQSSVKRSSGGRFARSLPLTITGVRIMNIHRLDSTLSVPASRELQYYANEGCKTCASLAGLLLTVVLVVIFFPCNF